MSRSGPTPYGYKRQGDWFVIVPEEAKICREIFELFLEHKRKKYVVDYLNNHLEYRTRSGAQFSSPTVTRILTNNEIIGVPGRVQAIIGKDLFDKCQTILQQHKNKSVSRKPSHVFAGVTFCQCGGKMLVPSKSKKYTCKQCKDKIYASDLEAIFIDQLAGHENIQLIELSRRWYKLSLEEKISIIGITTKRITVNDKHSQIIVTFLDI